MKMHFSSMKLRRFIARNLTSLISVGVVIGVGILCLVAVQSYISSQDALLVQESETSLLQQRVTSLQQSESLVADNLADYNNILVSLIPESEDFFSIINALETISQNTGFQINQYVVNLQTSQRDKLSIGIDGVGDKDSFVSFLQTYPFGGGRLITSANIQYSQGSVAASHIILDFYSKKTTVVNDSNTPKVTKLDITTINSLKSKLKLSLKTDDTATSTAVLMEYPTKTNPF